MPTAVEYARFAPVMARLEEKLGRALSSEEQTMVVLEGNAFTFGLVEKLRAGTQFYCPCCHQTSTAVRGAGEATGSP